MIREAVPKDAQGIERLYGELFGGGRTVRVLEDRIAEIRANPNSFLLVYENEEGLVGTAHLHLCLDALEGTRPFGVVERVVVAGEHQGKGYGTQLMRYIEGLCREHRCVKVMLTSNMKRTEAHEFYSRLDYNGERSKAFIKELPE
ncbi:GNAT family N-acetyltransferase [Gorillibacterium sp. sgz5001074]|uniref:GNAT family N-acetyltransferase n=1 Tax=Gorillibacterium sp. sgz5001074 TaxID=3446695 RepID=UPI003F676AB3